MRIVDDIQRVVQRIQVQFENEIRTCEIKGNLAELRIGSWSLGPFEAGSKIELPNWKIDIMLRHGLVELAPEAAFESSIRLQNIDDREKSDSTLQLLWPFLYSALRQKIARLQSDRSGLDPRTHSEIQRMQERLLSLTETRLTKILRIAKSGMYQDKLRTMTLEEQWLCQELAQTFSTWRDSVQSSEY